MIRDDDWCCYVQGQVLFINSLEETVRDAEFVFEVVPEDLKIKQQLFKSMTCLQPIFIRQIKVFGNCSIMQVWQTKPA